MTSDDDALLDLFGAIATRDRRAVTRTLDGSRDLATEAIRGGATRNGSDAYFLTPIRRTVYAGDTALHIAAAAYQREVAESLVALGADVCARNRRGAEPIHYASDGRADVGHSSIQSDVIAYLLGEGADPNARTKDDVAPLHRAVRTRSADAVRALIEHGADPKLKNKSGSTPLHLAVQTTGASHSGSDAAKEQQREIIQILLASGAKPTDKDAKGKTVAAAATSDWIRELLGVT